MAKSKSARNVPYDDDRIEAEALYTVTSLTLIDRAKDLSPSEIAQLLELLAHAVERSGLDAPKQAAFLADVLRQHAAAVRAPKTRARWLIAPRKGRSKSKTHEALRKHLRTVADFFLDKRSRIVEEHEDLRRRFRSNPHKQLTASAAVFLPEYLTHSGSGASVTLKPKHFKLAEDVATEVVKELRSTGVLPPRSSRKSRAH